MKTLKKVCVVTPNCYLNEKIYDFLKEKLEGIEIQLFYRYIEIEESFEEDGYSPDLIITNGTCQFYDPLYGPYRESYPKIYSIAKELNIPTVSPKNFWGWGFYSEKKLKKEIKKKGFNI